MQNIDYPKLRECPFCGRTDKLMVWEIRQRIDDKDCVQYTVVCDASGDKTGCGANCGFTNTKQDAIKAWNRRAEDA